MKDWIFFSFIFFGVGKFFTALNLAGSGDIPSSEIICPKYITSLRNYTRIYLFVTLDSVRVIAVVFPSVICCAPVGLIRILRCHLNIRDI